MMTTGGRRGSRLVVDIHLYNAFAPAARDHVALSLYDVASNSTTCHRHSSALPVEPSYNERVERREEEARVERVHTSTAYIRTR